MQRTMLSDFGEEEDSKKDLVLSKKLSVSGDTAFVYSHSNVEGLMELHIGKHESDALLHSVVKLDEPATLLLDHTVDIMTMFALFPPYKPIKRVLVIGLGGGSAIHYLRHFHPMAVVDVVDIENTIIEIAHQYFGVPKTDKQINIHCMDGTTFLQQQSQQKEIYDVIIQDAVNMAGHPLTSKAMYVVMDGLLVPGGMAIQNVFRHRGKLEDVMVQFIGAFPDMYILESEFNFILAGVKKVDKQARQQYAEYYQHPIAPSTIADSAIQQNGEERMPLEMVAEVERIKYYQ